MNCDWGKKSRELLRNTNTPLEDQDMCEGVVRGHWLPDGEVVFLCEDHSKFAEVQPMTPEEDLCAQVMVS